jgi:hypothetical protein
VAYVATEGGSLPVRSPLVRPLRPTRSAPFRNTGNGPVHVSDLLSREGHPLADRMVAAKEEHDAEAPGSSRRALGMAAGAMLVIGAVVGGALGLGGGNAGSPAATGEPLGALPGGTVNPGPGGAPASQDFTSSPEQAKPESEPAGEIGRPASVRPPANVQANSPRPAPAPAPAPPVAPPQQRVDPAPAAQGPVGALAAPVTDTVSPTLTNAVAPVTNTVDDTLQPALSLIGGLLGR